jgi:hypothetical protein
MRHLALLLAAALLASPATGQAEDKPAGPTITPYGFALLHMFFMDATFASRDNAYQVVARGPNDSNGAYQFSVRGSRVGLRVGNLDTGFVGAVGSAVLEYDVQGGYTGTTTTSRWSAALMRVRLANLKLDWKTGVGDVQVLAGQDFGLVGPVFANSLTWGTDPIFVRAGKIYRRTPQVRATFNSSFDLVTLNLAAAVLAASEGDGTSYDFGPGNRSRVPDLEGRLMVTVKPNADFNATANVSYHAHTRRYMDGTNPPKDINASIVNAGLDATLTRWVQVKGEYYVSEGAEDSYAGLAPGIVKPPPAATVAGWKAAKSTGYWGQLTLKPIPEIWLVGGLGSEQVDSSTKGFMAAAAWYKNAQKHVGVICNASKNLAFSAEVAMVESSYVNAPTQKGNEYSISTKMTF